MRVAVIGAGAAGCFCSVELRRRFPDAEVVVFEAGKRPLAKLAVTGGGRCNLTNSFNEVSSLADVYPRGEQLLKRCLRHFSNFDLMDWFEKEGVRLIVQNDQCVFPRSQDAMQIVNTLLRLMDRYGVRVFCESRVNSVNVREGGAFTVCAAQREPETFDAVIVTTGGSPKRGGLSFLDGLDLEIVEPVPSLFTFCIADRSLRSLMGTVVEDVTVSIPGTGFRARGPLLVTDWGVSAPAVLKLSSYAARWLAQKGYRAPFAVNWCGRSNEEEVREMLASIVADNPRKQLSSACPQFLSSRLWEHLISRAGIRPDIRCAELGRKSLNRLISTLTNDVYDISGKGQFKEEFVTCGGVALTEINFNTLESKKHPGLFFAGEVLDVDAVTGGFNLQAAWSTAYCVSRSVKA